jgi:hypothetical protein
MHQEHVDYGNLVDHEQIAVEGVLLAAPEAARLGIDL